jgi:hypothetical protein
MEHHPLSCSITQYQAALLRTPSGMARRTNSIAQQHPFKVRHGGRAGGPRHGGVRIHLRVYRRGQSVCYACAVHVLCMCSVVCYGIVQPFMPLYCRSTRDRVPCVCRACAVRVLCVCCACAVRVLCVCCACAVRVLCVCCACAVRVPVCRVLCMVLCNPSSASSLVKYA